MTSQKPYLIRAIYDWLLDNNQTPYLLVNATLDDVQVPLEFINDGKIVLNIEPGAVRNYHSDNDWISFSARFSGKQMELFIPIAAVQSIYGKESNEGMFFPDDEHPPIPPKTSKPNIQDNNPKKSKRPGLKLVK
ncbi:MAG: ClpXP protease specificity-enhancing factor [Gammaproteobacteria bacterium]|nr:MAG: ClpXP protease specificity-enhancing factor [Gammaproteobacteria bacterium]